MWRTQLFDASAHPSDWNYPGVVGVHQNGYVDVVYGTKLSKLDPDSKSFLPSMITADPENSRVYAMDAGIGQAGRFSLDQVTGEMKALWTQSRRTLNFSTLIGPPDKRVFIATDVPVKTIQGLKSYSTEAIVFRSAAIGEQLARSGELPKMTSGALVTPGADGRIYCLGLGGQVYRVSVAPG